MISSVDIKRQYVNLYRQLREFLWDFPFVCKLVDLEDESLRKFPDMRKVRSISQELYNMSKSARHESEELQQAFSDFLKTVQENECEYSYLFNNVKQ